MEVEPTSFPFSLLSPSLCVFKLVYLCEPTCAQLTYVYIPHTTYSSSVDMDTPCYRTTGTYPYIVLLLDYMYKVLDGVE